MRHWIWCDIDQIIPILTEASPRSILVLSGRYHIISNASLVNNCIIMLLKAEQCSRWFLHLSYPPKLSATTVNVLKFQTLHVVACQNCLNKQRRPRSDCFWRSSLIRVFSVCFSDKHFVNSSPENQHFVWEQKGKSVWNFRTFTILAKFQQNHGNLQY